MRNILRSRRDADAIGTSAFSPDGRILAYSQGTEQGEVKVVLWSHIEDRVQEIPLSLAPDRFPGKLTFSSDGKLFGACVGQQIQLWSLDPGGPRYSIPLIHDTSCNFGFRGGSRELAYLDGDEIVTWDIATERVATRGRPGPANSSRPGPLAGPDVQLTLVGPYRAVTFAVAPDGRSAIYIGAEGIVTSWDFDRQEAQAIGTFKAGADVSFTSDGRRATIWLSNNVMIFDVTRRMPIAVYDVSKHESDVSPDGRMIATVDGFGVTTLIDTGQYRGIPVNASRHAIQLDNEHVTTVFSAGGVAIYSIGNPEPIIVRNPEPIIVRNPAYDRSSGKRIEILSPNGLRYVFTDDQAQKIRLLDVSPSPAPEVPIEGNRSDVLQLAFDPSSDFLAGADKYEIIVWSAKSRTEVSRIPLPEGYATTGLAVSPGGRYVAANNSSGEIRLWDASSTDRAGTALPFEDGKSMSFSPDGRWLSIGGRNEIRLWDLNAGKFDSRRIPVGGFLMKFSPDGSLLATQTSQSGEISVWNVHDVLLRGTVSKAGGGGAFSFTSDNSRLAVGGAGVFVEPFDASWALQHVCHIVGRNLTREEWNTYLAGSDYVSTCPS